MAFADLDGHVVGVSNYKCFGNDPQGFEAIKPVNVIVGRNNTGKSALLDVVQHAGAPAALAGHGSGTLLRLGTPLTSDALIYALGQPYYGKVAHEWQGRTLLWTQGTAGNPPYDFEIFPAPHDSPDQKGLAKLWEKRTWPFDRRIVQRLRAERDIQPEKDTGSMDVSPTGVGATSLIQGVLNYSNLPREWVEDVLLAHLNRVVEPDLHFNRIVSQKNKDTQAWEVYLQEVGGATVALSHMGSGLKTIILVLCYLQLIPRVSGEELDRYVFCLEELENNLHPALERRLLEYLLQQAEANGCVFVLTTHSPVAIDFLAGENESQILHVTRGETSASVSSATDYIESRAILEDLDIRASDLLQSNAVIWVEGPSDRLYINRWIELATHGELHEGRHYQCMWYGGSLRSHVTAGDPSEGEAEELVRLLNVNRHGIFVMDRDSARSEDDLPANKARVLREARQMGLLGWLTDGREIENYLTTRAIEAALGHPVAQVPRKSDRFPQALERIAKGAGDRFRRNKVAFARRACEAMQEGDLDRLDLSQRIREVCEVIRTWNGMESDAGPVG